MNEEQELAVDLARAERNAEACPRREALVHDLSEALANMHGADRFPLSWEGRHERLNYWWQLLRATDCEIDEATDKEVRVLL